MQYWYSLLIHGGLLIVNLKGLSCSSLCLILKRRSSVTTFIPACEQSFGGRVRLWGFFYALLSGCSGQTALDCKCPCGVERSLCQAVWVSDSLTKLLSNMLCSITSSEWLTDGLSTAASCQQTCLLMLRSRFLRAAD